MHTYLCGTYRRYYEEGKTCIGDKVMMNEGGFDGEYFPQNFEWFVKIFCAINTFCGG